MGAISWNAWDDLFPYDGDRLAERWPEPAHDPHGDRDNDGIRLPPTFDIPRGPSSTFAARKDAMIAAGRCPMPGCTGRLEKDTGYCSGCGLVSQPKEAA